jgi:plasmid stability protein
MATLHVRNIPDELYERLQQVAGAHNRSLSAQVTVMLDEALQSEERRQRQRKALAGIRRRRWVPPAGAPDSVQVLRQIRGYDR